MKVARRKGVTLQALSIGEIHGLTVCELSKRKFLVVGSLKVHLKSSRTLDEASALIFEWSATDDVRYELAHDLQEDLAAATGRKQCSFCQWVPNPGQTNCCEDPSLDIIEPFDDYPNDATIEDWDQAFGSLADENPDDDLLEIDSADYVLERV